MQENLSIPKVKELRTVKIVDVPSTGKTQIEDAVKYLSQLESFDPSKEEYQFPITDQNPYSYDGLRALGEFPKVEIKIVSHFDKEDGKWKSRMITGTPRSNTLASLDSVKWHTRKETNEQFSTVNFVDGYPILDDEGNTSGELWDVGVHNHPDNDPYPSNGDIRGQNYHEKVSVIVSGVGVTVFGRIPDPITLNLPKELDGINLEQKNLFSRVGYLNQILAYIELYNPPDKSLDPVQYQIETKKKMMDLTKTPFRILKWDEDRAQIEGLLNKITAGKFDQDEFFRNK